VRGAYILLAGALRITHARQRKTLCLAQMGDRLLKRMTLRLMRIASRRGTCRSKAGRTLIVRGAALAAVGAMLVVAIGSPVGARTVSGTFRATARVYAGCTMTTPDLVIPAVKDQVTPAFGVTTFAVNCGGASFAHPLPVRFTFAPASGSGIFEMNEGKPKNLPYRLCNDSACTEVYVSGVAGPVVDVNKPAFSYRLWGEAFPPPTGLKPGSYKQDVNVTLTY
jgi:hypothetical protein